MNFRLAPKELQRECRMFIADKNGERIFLRCITRTRRHLVLVGVAEFSADPRWQDDARVEPNLIDERDPRHPFLVPDE